MGSGIKGLSKLCNPRRTKKKRMSASAVCFISMISELHVMENPHNIFRVFLSPILF
jgi:hypothetical protein